MSKRKMAQAVGVAARVASAVAIAHGSVSEARAEALDEPDEHLRKEKVNLVDNIENGINTFDTAYQMGRKVEGILSNDSLEAPVASELSDVMSMAGKLVNDQIENVKRNISRINEIEPGSIGFHVPDDPHNDFLAIGYESYDEEEQEDGNENKNDDDNNNDNIDNFRNEDEEKQIVLVGERDDYETDNSDHENNNGDDDDDDDNNENESENRGLLERQRPKQKQRASAKNEQSQQVRKKVARKRRIVYYRDEGKLRKTPEYSKFAVILSAFFYAGFVILKQLRNVR